MHRELQRTALEKTLWSELALKSLPMAEEESHLEEQLVSQGWHVSGTGSSNIYDFHPLAITAGALVSRKSESACTQPAVDGGEGDRAGSSCDHPETCSLKDLG